MGGEIDIMECLNYDIIVYQIIYINYMYNLGIKDNLLLYFVGVINFDDYNVYLVEMYLDSIVFYINDIYIFIYFCIEIDKEGQFFFDQFFYLLIDMQLGGLWVGVVDLKEFLVEMYVDWVRFYQKEKQNFFIL